MHASVIDFGEDGDGISLEIAMQWNGSYSESVHTFANTINTAEGGTHEEGFRAALTSIINKYAREQKLLREKDDNLTGEDVREGLTAIVSVKLADPQFEGQTKTKLGNTEAKSFVQKVCNDHLRDWFDRNPGEAKDIITKAMQAAAGPDRGPAGPRPHPAQEPAREQLAAGQAGGLPVVGPGPVRGLRRRGRLGRRLREGRPEPASSRRSCRSGARSSTWRRPGSTGC